MKPKRPTSSEVAKLAGVSRTTVSLVLNGVERVHIAETTKARVLNAAKTLGYRPDAAARTLASGRTEIIGLLICHAEHLRVDAFIPQALLGLQQVSQQRGFKVIVEAVENPQKPGAYLELVRSKQVDGLAVLNPRYGDADLRKLVEEGFPLVIMGASTLAQAHTLSSTDNAAAAQRAAAHLIALGHTRIAHISYGSLDYQGANERFEGYRRALAAAELTYDAGLVREGDYSAQSGYAAMHSLLEPGTDFTALFASNDTLALGAMAALRAHGLRIPEDVAVVGYDDIPLAAYAAPPLTTIRSPALEHGRLAGEMLMQLISGQPPVRAPLELELPLIVRESCGAKR